MKVKKGAGNRLQAFGERNGRYVKEAGHVRENSILLLSLLSELGADDETLIKVFPKYGVSDEEYCKLFVRMCRDRIKQYIVPEGKIKYLLTKQEQDDKSIFLNRIGYNIDDKGLLLGDIVRFTDFKTLNFSRISIYSLNCKATTILAGHYVTTYWKLTLELNLSLITLIPKGEKK